MPTKHTPGPWHVYEFSGFETEIYRVSPNKPIAKATELADARLMAAAPELLAALENLLAWANIQDHHSLLSQQVRVESLSAIAKAKGQSK